MTSASASEAQYVVMQCFLQTDTWRLGGRLVLKRNECTQTLFFWDDTLKLAKHLNSFITCTVVMLMALKFFVKKQLSFLLFMLKADRIYQSGKTTLSVIF